MKNKHFSPLAIFMFLALLLSCNTATNTSIKYKVTFETEYGASSLTKTEIEAEENTTITLPVLEDTDYNFLGWYEGSTLVTSPYRVTKNTTLKASWSKKGVVTISPSDNLLSKNDTVTLSTTDANSIIYYTTNGETPTINSTVYTTPIVITDDTLIKAICVSGSTISKVYEKEYFIKISVTYKIDGRTDVIKYYPKGIINPLEIDEPHTYFDGWYKDNTYQTKWDDQNDILSSDIILYGKASIVEPVTNLQVTPNEQHTGINITWTESKLDNFINTFISLYDVTDGEEGIYSVLFGKGLEKFTITNNDLKNYDNFFKQGHTYKIKVGTRAENFKDSEEISNTIDFPLLEPITNINVVPDKDGITITWTESKLDNFINTYIDLYDITNGEEPNYSVLFGKGREEFRITNTDLKDKSFVEGHKYRVKLGTRDINFQDSENSSSEFEYTLQKEQQ